MIFFQVLIMSDIFIFALSVIMPGVVVPNVVAPFVQQSLATEIKMLKMLLLSFNRHCTTDVQFCYSKNTDNFHQPSESRPISFNKTFFKLKGTSYLNGAQHCSLNKKNCCSRTFIHCYIKVATANEQMRAV
jgi:hypothetical protein